ncbi:MAG TPA: hypothetical protein VEI02_15815 [Planctomycetota bacterium]|nr:hypothetical protein [Planctomycetota bacterium]
MPEAPKVLFSQSFKKYTSEHRPDLVAYVKDWAKGKGATVRVHEDASLLKVTADQATVEGLREDLKVRFPGWKPEGIEGADDKKK